MKSLLSICLTLLVTTALSSAAPNDRFAQIILFVEEGAEPAANYKKRLNSLALRTEAFFTNQLKRWNRPVERTQIFARNEKGNVQISVVKGKLLNPAGRAALPKLNTMAINGAAKQLDLKKSGPPVVFWIFYDYPGVKGFQGGARKSGGVAVNKYPAAETLIHIKADLASPALNETAIKGTIHEFGHALGLPHIGPRPRRKLGNTLMGPINKVYWRRTKTEDPRVFLSEASAAALWKHPIFKKESSPNPKMPAKVDIENLATTSPDDQQKIIITGKLNSDQKAHTVVALDSERGKFGDYWERPYVAGIDPEGNFKLEINAPRTQGTIFLSFSFENGINTSDGKKTFQQNSAISRSYSTKEGKRVFADQNQ